jgi:AraC family transcriptional regulator of adaptative response / DNA-3-methyladenine glycosylase II
VLVERRLGYTAPFDGVGVLTFLAARALPGVEQVDVEGLRYRRSVRLDGPDDSHGATGGILTLDLGALAGRSEVLLRVDALGGISGPQLDDLAETSRRLLDLDLDPARVAATVGADPALAQLVARRPGLRVPGGWDPFELVARAVLGQQISVGAARTLLGRLVRLAGPLVGPSSDPSGDRCFPGPAEVAAADLDRLGLPGSRRRTLRAVAEAMASGSLVLRPRTDPAVASAQLMALPGIGPWTAAYVALRALGDADSLLVGDLGLAKAAARRGLPDRWPALVAHAERWRPWRGYASFWLWSALAE